jgi:hypothetical protein
MDTALKVSQIGADARLPHHLRRRAQDGRQRPAAHRLLPRLRLGREIHRRLHARGGARCRLHGAHVDQGVRAGGHGPACRLDRRRGRSRGQTSPASRRTSSCSRKSLRASSVSRARARVRHKCGYCVIVVSEGPPMQTAGSWPMRAPRMPSDTRSSAGVAPVDREHDPRGARLQVPLGGRRLPASAQRHIASRVDVEQAYASAGRRSSSP